MIVTNINLNNKTATVIKNKEKIDIQFTYLNGIYLLTSPLDKFSFIEIGFIENEITNNGKK